MSDPLHCLQQFLVKHSQLNRWLVAYSGGMDSSALLHALVSLSPPQPVVALHIHHNLSANADVWAQHCRSVCERLGTEFQLQRVQIDRARGGLENAARQARYRVFESRLQAGDGLLMAHHLDDQAETMLLRLMRGSGARGLAAMHESRPLGSGQLFRPWLAVSRDAIAELARELRIDWIEDESNSSEAFDRNYLRHKVMPMLRERWPEYGQRWQASASLLQQYDRLAEQIAAADLHNAQPRAERLGYSICRNSLKPLDAFRRGNLWRHWMRQLGWPLPEKIQLDEIESQLLQPAASEAQVSWGEVRVRYFRDRLHVFLRQSPVPVEDLAWDGRGELRWGDWCLTLQSAGEPGFALPRGGLIISPRRGGERCQPSWRRHSQTLKKLLQEMQLEPWLRDQVPLVRSAGDQKLLAVADLWVCRDAVGSEAAGFNLRWRLASQASSGETASAEIN